MREQMTPSPSAIAEVNAQMKEGHTGGTLREQAGLPELNPRKRKSREAFVRTEPLINLPPHAEQGKDGVVESPPASPLFSASPVEAPNRPLVPLAREKTTGEKLDEEFPRVSLPPEPQEETLAEKIERQAAGLMESEASKAAKKLTFKLRGINPTNAVKFEPPRERPRPTSSVPEIEIQKEHTFADLPEPDGGHPLEFPHVYGAESKEETPLSGEEVAAAFRGDEDSERTAYGTPPLAPATAESVPMLAPEAETKTRVPEPVVPVSPRKAFVPKRTGSLNPHAASMPEVPRPLMGALDNLRRNDAQPPTSLGSGAEGYSAHDPFDAWSAEAFEAFQKAPEKPRGEKLQELKKVIEGFSTISTGVEIKGKVEVLGTKGGISFAGETTASSPKQSSSEASQGKVYDSSAWTGRREKGKTPGGSAGDKNVSPKSGRKKSLWSLAGIAFAAWLGGGDTLSAQEGSGMPPTSAPARTEAAAPVQPAEEISVAIDKKGEGASNLFAQLKVEVAKKYPPGTSGVSPDILNILTKTPDQLSAQYGFLKKGGVSRVMHFGDTFTIAEDGKFVSTVASNEFRGSEAVPPEPVSNGATLAPERSPLVAKAMAAHANAPTPDAIANVSPPKLGFENIASTPEQPKDLKAFIAEHASEPHIYADRGGQHLFVYGGTPAAQADLMNEFFQNSNVSAETIVYGTDVAGKKLLPFTRDTDGSLTSPGPARAHFLGFSWFKGAPNPKEFKSLVQ